MKFFLQSGFFIPMIILWSVFFVPIILLTLAGTIYERTLPLIIILSVLIILYAFSLFVFYKLSKSKKYYLIAHEDRIIINYPNFSQTDKGKCVMKSDIVKIEYYRLLSIRGLLNLHNYVLPRCVFLTYIENEKEKCKLIGYLKPKEIKKFCEDNNFMLEIK